MGSYLGFDTDLGKDRVGQANREVPGERALQGDAAGPLIPGHQNKEKLSQTDLMNCS